MFRNTGGTPHVNERGWLRSSTSPLFAMQLNYNEEGALMFNGNISKQYWGTPGNLNKNYVYTYDVMNRLTSGIATGSSNSETITYDDDLGNIKTLVRSGSASGSYTYSYLSNRLKSVSGLTSSDYVYDANGSMTFDARNNTNVDYNVLNLPRNIPGKSLSYVYDASGSKLQRTLSGVTTDYVDGIQYDGGTLTFIQTEEGRIMNLTGTPNYEYSLKDHLGNTRVTFDSSTGAVAKQTDDYYPFGLVAYQPSTPSPQNKYLYNGKELQDGLGQYDYGARFYDPVVGRWSVPDPLAELSMEFSPFAYCNNNPILLIDPLGLKADTGIVLSEVIIRAARQTERFLMETPLIPPYFGTLNKNIGKLSDKLKIDNGVNDFGGIITNSLLNRKTSTFSGAILSKLKKDPGMAKFKAKLLKILKADPKLKNLHFSDLVEFGGEWEDGNKLNVTTNELTWAIRHSTVTADAVVKSDGTIVVKFSTADVLDLTPQETRSSNYNRASMFFGSIYHGLLGGSMDMQTTATWTETIK